ncbi:MAG TPA: DoxX family protein [Pseudomonadota bacterium]|nr:DoxX family protein [Pseudomonadota bacterium]
MKFADDPPSPQAQRRQPLAELGFRFCFVYFSLYIFFTQMLTILFILPVGELPEFGALFPMRHLVLWVARHVFKVEHTLVVTNSGSGDKIYDWVQVACILTLATMATAAWSAIVRGQSPSARLVKWFRLVVRFAVSATMISYGMVKAIPLQMPAPQLTRLLEPFGNFSPMGVLWYSVGASHPYEIFAGSAELLAGVLLFLPHTATLGALVCLADAIQIFTLNMTYDVPVKLLSFHLVLFSLFLLAPEVPRLLNVLLLNRPAAPSPQPPLFSNPRRNRIATICQAVFGAYLVGVNLYSAIQGWYSHGGGAPKSPLYGIWNVTTMSIDGQLRSPLIGDYDRWRRVVFQTPTTMSFQRMDDTLVPYTTAIDMNARSLSLTKASDKSWKALWTFERAAAEQLSLDGDMDGHHIHMQLQLFDHRKFLLLSRGFHWTQDYPFNR